MDSEVESDRAVLRDPSSVLQMASLLEKHLESLSAARESLATFLRERFNIEDLLSVRKPVSKFDRIHTMHRMSDDGHLVGKSPAQRGPRDRSDSHCFGRQFCNAGR
jgi:hypothetical protein